MFDIGWGELVVIGIVALIAIGPKELPGVLRTCGQWMGKIRRMANEFQGQFQEAMREAEIVDLKKQFDEASSAATNLTTQLENPIEAARKDIEGAFTDKPAEPAPPAAVEPAAPSPATPSEPTTAAPPKTEGGPA